MGVGQGFEPIFNCFMKTEINPHKTLYICPPVAAIPIDIAGMGSGWGPYSGQLIEAATKLTGMSYQ